MDDLFSRACEFRFSGFKVVITFLPQLFRNNGFNGRKNPLMFWLGYPWFVTRHTPAKIGAVDFFKAAGHTIKRQSCPTVHNY
jgi:hypothetical protein